MTKFFVICALALTATACQQKPATREAAPGTLPKPSSQPTKTTKFNSTCSAKYTTTVYKADGTTEVKKFETNTRSNNESVLIKVENEQNHYQVTGSYFYEENLVAADGTKNLENNSDYTYVGTRIGSTVKVSENTYEKNSVRDYTRTGRNGYKFRNKDKQLVDTEQRKSTEKFVYFDDGQSYYTISYVINGKDIMPDNFELLTTYTETTVGDKVTTLAKSTLRNPHVIKDANGKVLEETADYEENCTEETVSSK